MRIMWRPVPLDPKTHGEDKEVAQADVQDTPSWHPNCWKRETVFFLNWTIIKATLPYREGYCKATVRLYKPLWILVDTTQTRCMPGKCSASELHFGQGLVKSLRLT